MCVVGVAVALISGCGGSSTTTPITTVGPTGATGPGGPISPAVLIAQGDPICAEAYTALAGLPVNVTGVQEAQILQGLVESLQATGDPGTQNKGDLEQFYTSLKTAAKDYKAGDTTGAQSALAQARSAAASYGFKDCAKQGKAISGGGAGGTGAGTSSGGVSTVPAPATTTTPAPAPVPAPAPAPAPPSSAGGTGNPAPAPPPSSGGSGGTSGNTGGVSPG